MIRLRKVSLVNDIQKSRTPLFYWSLAGGAITTAVTLGIGYFIYTYRLRQRTRQAIAKGEADRLVYPKGLTSQELEKAIALLEQEKVKERVQFENFERYKRLREQRRQQEGLVSPR